jgi:conjugal transfer pilus assembly protein TraK
VQRFGARTDPLCALVDDQFASVSKISTGTPYNDFAVTNEPVRGDIYVSVPETYAARSISFFATTKKGFVYKVACRVEQIPATQVFVTNPAIAKNRAADWESQTPLETSAVRLIQAMANDRTVDGYEVRPSDGHARTGRRSRESSSSPIIAAPASPGRSSASTIADRNP